MLKRIKALAAVVLLVIFMYALAEVSLKGEAIFPEVAALAVGAWYVRNSWGEDLLNLWLSPSLAALTGVGMVHFARLPQEVLIPITFVLVLLELYLLRSKILPAISASILPILLHVDSLYYPLSVLLLTGIIAGGCLYVRRVPTGGHAAPFVPQNERRQWWNAREATFWLKVFFGFVLVVAIASRTTWIYLMAPPLIVAYIEFARSSDRRMHARWRLFWLLFLAAVSGSVVVEVAHVLWHAPLWVAAACTMTLVLVLFRRFHVVFPPAAAISLLPTIIPEHMVGLYPLQVAVGALLFLAAGQVIISSTKDPSMTASPAKKS